MRNAAASGTAVAVLGGALFFTPGVASAQPFGQEDGLVALSIRDLTILEDATTDQAARMTANVCDVTVDQAAALSADVDKSGLRSIVCESPLGPVMLEQNLQQDADGV